MGNRRARIAIALWLAALLWALALLPTAFYYPVGRNQSEASVPVGESPPPNIGDTTTIVEAEGMWVIAPLSLAAVISLLVGLALNGKCSPGRVRAETLAWAGIILLVGLTLVTGFSIGFFFVPTVVLLFFAAISTPEPSRRPVRSGR